MVDIALTADDLAGVTFAHSAVWEVAASIFALGQPRGHYMSRPLRRQMTAGAFEETKRLLELTTIPGWLPDTLSPQPPSRPEAADVQLARIRDTADDAVAGDLEVLGRHLGWSTWSAMCPDEYVETLTSSLIRYWKRELRPKWEVIEGVIAADVAVRQSGLAHDGLGKALAQLHPSISYAHSVVTVDLKARDCQIPGTGAGMRLVPSVFRWPKVGLSTDGAGAIVISYPAVGAGTVWDEPKQRDRGLGSLMGRSRASVLRDLDVPRTTTALARRLGLAPATVSAHLSTMAAVGLVQGGRQGRVVMYSRTALGSRLMGGGEVVEELG